MPYKNYSSENLDNALASVRNGKMTAYKASKLYKVPYQTLLDKIKNKHTNPSGHATVLTKDEEKLIVEWIHHMSEIGFPVTREQLPYSVGQFVTELNRPNPFKDGIPGRHWYEGFLKRNPDVSSRVSQALATARIGATEERIRHWFDRVHKYLEENDCLDILQDPSRIFNCDESAFFSCPKGQAALARRGQKENENENLTLCLGASADGKLMPILALFPDKRIPMDILQKYPKTWVIGASDNGWMTCQTFYEYIANSFNGFLLKKNIQKPVLLFLDGHVSHLSLPLTTFCKENGIILMALLPSSTYALQPMDVPVFHALKSSWKQSVFDWRMAHNAKEMGREDFGPILKECIQKTLKPDILINGFRLAGLFPFDQGAVNYDKLLKSSKSRDAGSSSDAGSTSDPRLAATLIDVQLDHGRFPQQLVLKLTKKRKLIAKYDIDSVASTWTATNYEEQVNEQDLPGPSKILDTGNLSDSLGREQDPLSRVIEQCRFCGEFSKDCVAVSSDMTYLAGNKTTLALNETSVQLDFNHRSLPKAACRDCDAKLKEFCHFVNVVKAAQSTLINVAEEKEEFETGAEFEETTTVFEETTAGFEERAKDETETLIIKTEYDSQQEHSDDDKDGIVDSLTVGETVFVRETHKRKSDTDNTKPKKLKTKEKCGGDDYLIIDIKEEVVEKDANDGHGQSEVSDTGTDVKPSELELATSALVFEMAEEGTSEYQGYRSDR